MSSKFKFGDRVVVKEYRYSTDYWPVKQGEVGVVERIHPSNNPRLYYISSFNTSGPYKEDDLELEEVYNSPLYKALT